MIRVFCLILICFTGCIPKKQNPATSTTLTNKPVELSLLGPFSLLNSKENIDKERAKTDEWQNGEMFLENAKILPVSLKIRGNNSLEECRFRKLKLKWDKNSIESNPLGVKSNKLKIGTHCQKIEGQTKVLGNELSVLRENFLLQIYALMSDFSLRSSTARIRYIESTDKKDLGTYFALLRENEDEFALRNKLTAATPEDSEKLANYDLDSLASTIFFQSLAGNTDWRIAGLGGEPMGPRGLWNTEVYRNETVGKGQVGLISVPSDLDIARTIVMLDKTSLPEYYWVAKNITDLKIQNSAVFSLEMLLRNFSSLPSSSLLKAISKFQMIKQKIQPLFDLLDDESREFFKNHIRDFSRAISAINSMASVSSGTLGRDFEGKLCTVRSDDFVFLGKIEKNIATVFIPFDDGEIPFCMEGFSPRNGLTLDASKIVSLQQN